MKIAPYPFSDEGSERWPFYAYIVENSKRGSRVTDFVVKRYKEVLGKAVAEQHKKGRYLEQIEMQSVCATLAHEFNDHIK